MGFCVFFVLSCITLCHSSFAIILKRKRKLVALLLLSYRCIVNVMWLCLTVPLVGLQCVIVVFPNRTHLLLEVGKYGISHPKGDYLFLTF